MEADRDTAIPRTEDVSFMPPSPSTWRSTSKGQCSGTAASVPSEVIMGFGRVDGGCVNTMY